MWLCVPWLIHVCAMTHWYGICCFVCHDSCIWLGVSSYDIVRHDSCIWPWLIQRACHDSFNACAMTHSARVPWPLGLHLLLGVSRLNNSIHSFIPFTHSFHSLIDMIDSLIWLAHWYDGLIDMIDSLIWLTHWYDWLIDMIDWLIWLTHWYGWLINMIDSLIRLTHGTELGDDTTSNSSHDTYFRNIHIFGVMWLLYM